jgi:TPR repeat protein
MIQHVFPLFLSMSIIVLTFSGCSSTTNDPIVPTKKTALSANKSASIEETYQAGINYNKKNYFIQAAQQFREAAKQGHVEAQLQLAEMYFDGKGVARDPKKTAQWYGKAAEQGHANAQHLLGALYLVGIGVPKDSSQAKHWYHQAAKQGHADAQLSLGMMYYHGNGIPQDLTEARKWLSLAAKQGNKDAIAAYDKVSIK